MKKKINSNLNTYKKNIHENIEKFIHEKNISFSDRREYIGYAGSVYDHNEIIAMVDTILDGWFALGKKGGEFENLLQQFVGCNSVVLTNSGSSANLAAISALTSNELENALKPGDEVITPACTFPTTLNPIIQNNLEPVFVDVDLGSYNINLDQVENAITDKTKAIMFPHSLGNPVNMDRLTNIASKHNLIMIEDCCDALGTTYDGRQVGTFGTLGTCSFYPAHHLTTAGEGGAVFVNGNYKLNRIVKSFISWGRDCWCSSDEKNKNGACCRRFEYFADNIPYDHKFLYSHIGYNLKPTEIQAAMGIEQMNKLPFFIEKRKENFYKFHLELTELEDYLILPSWEEKADPSWFSFPITIKDESLFTRRELVGFLEDEGIQTRNLFAGNILRHPAYKNREWTIRSSSNLLNSDKVMANSFFFGVYPGLTDLEIEYIISKIKEFVRKKG